MTSTSQKDLESFADGYRSGVSNILTDIARHNCIFGKHVVMPPEHPEKENERYFSQLGFHKGYSEVYNAITLWYDNNVLRYPHLVRDKLYNADWKKPNKVNYRFYELRPTLPSSRPEAQYLSNYDKGYHEGVLLACNHILSEKWFGKSKFTPPAFNEKSDYTKGKKEAYNEIYRYTIRWYNDCVKNFPHLVRKQIINSDWTASPDQLKNSRSID